MKDTFILRVGKKYITKLIENLEELSIKNEEEIQEFLFEQSSLLDNESEIKDRSDN